MWPIKPKLIAIVQSCEKYILGELDLFTFFFLEKIAVTVLSDFFTFFMSMNFFKILADFRVIAGCRLVF